MTNAADTAIQTILDQTDSDIASYLETCVHCGECAEACHFYLATKDPKYTPTYKLTPLVKAYKRHKAPLRGIKQMFGLVPDEVTELVEQTWRVVDGGRFKIVIEAWLAARNDPALGATIGPVVERFAKLVDPAERRELLPDAESRALYLATREAILGLALGRATTDGPLVHERAVVDTLVELARAHDATTTGGTR